jgi:hypothetical protein
MAVPLCFLIGWAPTCVNVQIKILIVDKKNYGFTHQVLAAMFLQHLRGGKARPIRECRHAVEEDVFDD